MPQDVFRGNCSHELSLLATWMARPWRMRCAVDLRRKGDAAGSTYEMNVGRYEKLQ